MELTAQQIAEKVAMYEKELEAWQEKVEYLESEIARFQEMCPHPRQDKNHFMYGTSCWYCPDCHQVDFFKGE